MQLYDIIVEFTCVDSVKDPRNSNENCWLQLCQILGDFLDVLHENDKSINPSWTCKHSTFEKTRKLGGIAKIELNKYYPQESSLNLIGRDEQTYSLPETN